VSSHNGRLNRYLKRSGIASQWMLCLKAGLWPQDLFALRKGQVERLRITTVERVAALLNLELSVFLAEFGSSKLSKNLTERQSLREQIADLQHRLEETEAERGELKNECTRLQARLETQHQELGYDFRTQAMQQLRSLLVQLPTVRQAAQKNPALGAATVTKLLGSLDNLVADWGYEPIGRVWEAVPYDPHQHQTDGDELAAGEMVYIRFLGYRQGDEVLFKAKVSRELPAGAR
jgi:molecular chaperone GrpE (heat shock protein)